MFYIAIKPVKSGSATRYYTGAPKAWTEKLVMRKLFKSEKVAKATLSDLHVKGESRFARVYKIK